jgi:hypothetical protein
MFKVLNLNFLLGKRRKLRRRNLVAGPHALGYTQPNHLHHSLSVVKTTHCPSHSRSAYG